MSNGCRSRLSRLPVPMASAVLIAAAVPLSAPLAATEGESLFFEEIPVVLSATRLNQSAADSPAAITVIDRDMIEASGALRLVELFRLIPGMHVGYVSGARFTVSQHGIADRYARRLQVLIDGRSVYDPGYGGVPWFDLPIDIGDIERIEAIRGPNAATYGSNAFSGTINIITRHPAADAGTRVSATLGEEDTKIASLSHSGSGHELDYRLTFKHQEDSGFQNRFDSSEQDWLNIRGDWQINTTDSLLVQFGISDGHRNEGFPDDFVNPTRENGHQYSYQQIRWSRNSNPGAEYVVQFYHNHLDVNDDFQIPVPPGLLPPGLNLYAGWGFETDRYDLEFQATNTLSPGLRLVWGAGARHDESRSIWMFNTQDTIERDQGRLFLNTEWHATDQLVTNIGLMTEFTEGLDPLYSPRLGLNYHIDTSNTIRVSASQAYRLPSLFEENADQMAYMTEALIPFNRFFYSYGGIEPERIRSLELGYVGTFPAIGLDLNARLFRERITSMITEVYDYSIEDPVPTDIEPGTLRAMNDGKVTIDGLEIGLKYTPTDRGFVYFGYSYLDADGRELRYDPIPDEYHGRLYRNLGNRVTQHLFSLLGSYRFDNGVRLSSGFYYSDDVVWAGDGDWVPSYHRWDLKLDRTFALEKTDLNMALIYRHVDADQLDFYNNPRRQQVNEWDDALFVQATMRFR